MAQIAPPAPPALLTLYCLWVTLLGGVFLSLEAATRWNANGCLAATVRPRAGKGTPAWRYLEASPTHAVSPVDVGVAALVRDGAAADDPLTPPPASPTAVAPCTTTQQQVTVDSDAVVMLQ